MTPFFLQTVVFILGVTAAAKLISATGETRILQAPDPLLMVETRSLLIGVSLAELALAAYLFFGRSNIWKLSLTAWMASTFLFYRIGLWWTGAGKPCGCMGTLADSLPLTPRTIDLGMKGALAWLLLGGFSLLYMEWRQARHTNLSLPSLAEEEKTPA